MPGGKVVEDLTFAPLLLCLRLVYIHIDAEEKKDDFAAKIEEEKEDGSVIRTGQVCVDLDMNDVCEERNGSG